MITLQLSILCHDCSSPRPRKGFQAHSVWHFAGFVQANPLGIGMFDFQDQELAQYHSLDFVRVLEKGISGSIPQSCHGLRSPKFRNPGLESGRFAMHSSKPFLHVPYTELHLESIPHYRTDSCGGKPRTISRFVEGLQIFKLRLGT